MSKKGNRYSSLSDYGEFPFKIDELNAVKDFLRDPVSRIDQTVPIIN